ncbi:histidine phosphatase family protein [Streptomyces sp. NBC_00101]|uniref:histidine-type phosphatase n=1 Tax=Streptomyces sp. NBC_00101 TaxID=2975651 RepID=UPI0032559BCF
MKRTLSSLAALALAAAAVTTAGPAASAHTPAPGSGRHFYTTKTTYAPQQDPRAYEAVPASFTPVFTESVSRHGSRAMSDSEDGDAVLAVVRDAESEGALTRLGARLGPQVESLLAAASSVGYGELAGRGVQEQRQTARRMEQRLPSLFRRIVAGREPVEVKTSGVARATASADAFTGGLTAGEPDLAELVQAPVTDKDLLYFHKQPQNAAYREYVENDTDLAAVLARIDGAPATARNAREVAARLFTGRYVAAMTAEERIAFARSLYELYAAAPDLRVEAPGVDLDVFVPARNAQWFSYLDDAEEFYEKGPSFSGRTITYDMADVLLDDLFDQVEAKAAGTSTKGAALRFTHAEEIIPLAVLLGLPGSTEPAELDEPYTYKDNAWRGARVAPMAANVQWDLFAGPRQSGKKGAVRGTRYLVRMLYNEKETSFKASCRPVSRGSHFYDLDELRRCFDRG